MSLSAPFARGHALPLLTVVILGLIILLPPPAHASEERFVGDVVVKSGAVAPEVSTVVGNVAVHGQVKNDVRAGLGDVYVDGEVGGDVDAGSGEVRIEGPVDGDVRAEFGNVYVNAPVKGDVDVGRGDVVLGPRAVVDGDLEFGSGKFTGNVDAVKGDMVSMGTAPDFDEHDILGFVGWIFASLAFAACTVLSAVLAPRPLAAAARRVEESPWRSFVYGLVSLPVFFVLCVVLAVSIVGIPLLLLLAPAYLALLFCGALVAAFFLGSRVLLITGRYRVGNALAAVVGAMILAVTTLIPLLGDLLLCALALLGTGAVILALFSRRPRPAYPSYEAYVRDRASD